MSAFGKEADGDIKYNIVYNADERHPLTGAVGEEYNGESSRSDRVS